MSTVWREQVEGLRDLQDGWCEDLPADASVPPSALALEVAEEECVRLQSLGVCPTLLPTPEGGIVIEWHDSTVINAHGEIEYSEDDSE